MLKHHYVSMYDYIFLYWVKQHISVFKEMVRQDQEWEFKFLLTWWDSSHSGVIFYTKWKEVS
jgi:hypothetical protein